MVKGLLGGVEGGGGGVLMAAHALAMACLALTARPTNPVTKILQTIAAYACLCVCSFVCLFACLLVCLSVSAPLFVCALPAYLTLIAHG